MIFSSLLFLFWFIPVFFIIYYAVPSGYRNLVLFIGSIVFYGWGEPKYLLLIFVSILVNYFCGIFIEKTAGRAKTAVLLCGIVFDVSMLLFFKYINFFIENINAVTGASLSSVGVTLPLGISFYTFQIMSYIIDTYKGTVKAQHSVLKLSTYLIMFPQLIAGPIVVYSKVSEALDNRRITPDKLEEGISTFLIGLSSKVIMANGVGRLWDELPGIGYDRISMPLAWLGALAFTLQIYFDFNGYSLMAIGLGKLLGFEFPRNFDLPYISRSVTEFYRRWHMTLSSWFKDYVYIPLGGSRRGKIRSYANLFIVWFLTGFWHGASWNFVLWGMFLFALVSIERLFLKGFLERHAVFSHLYTMICIMFSWVIFAITDFSSLGLYIRRMFSFDAGTDIIYYAANYGFVLLLGAVISTGLLRSLYEKITHKWVRFVINVFLLVICTAYLADAGYNPFLYFRF
ncbi:MAG: MBOAT family protein [Lachnospiraceae bacterium]|nr:MBOAT family protein [Lachnospiraceae bacterium]